jgi:RNA recognition motif-containing protein
MNEASLLFIGNLTPSTTEADLEEVFSKMGKIVTVRVPTDFQTGRSKHVAYVQFADQESVDKALDQLQGVALGGRPMRIKIARPIALAPGRRGRPADPDQFPDRYRPSDFDFPPRDIPPRDILPRDILPRDILPRDILPRDILPRDILPRDIPLRDIAPLSYYSPPYPPDYGRRLPEYPDRRRLDWIHPPEDVFRAYPPEFDRRIESPPDIVGRLRGLAPPPPETPSIEELIKLELERRAAEDLQRVSKGQFYGVLPRFG